MHTFIMTIQKEKIRLCSRETTNQNPVWKNRLVQDRERSRADSSLFKLYDEYIMRNTRLDELRARIKIGGRNINNLRYADDTTLMAESEEDLKSILMRLKEESERTSLRLNIKKQSNKQTTTNNN